MKRIVALFALLLLALPGLFLLTSCSRGPKTDPAYVAEVDLWHAQRIERLKGETGWLTLVGLHELKPGINTVGSASGSGVQFISKAPPQVGKLEVGELGVIFQADPAAQVALFDSTAAPVQRVLLDTDAAGRPTQLACGSLVFYVIDRQGRLFVRVKDRQSSVLRGFTGIDRFPVDARWRVQAHLEGMPGDIEIENVLGQKSLESRPGRLVFELGGKTCRVSPTVEPGGGLFLVFADPTNGDSTDPAGRFLSIDAPDSNGVYTVDFNRAYNPPCCFTPFATCPLPPPQNRLPVKVPAGEKMWGQGH
ncbi:hypothetical protein CO151_07945 [bacterium CG_4_9_14_3_um_filter_65_15]|nr:MAG: hypothetical protein CO151_07945 [bacterium CG_4_9_14_3_um_filter_65_15]